MFLCRRLSSRRRCDGETRLVSSRRRACQSRANGAALHACKERGFRIKTYGDIYRSRGYLAGDDATRAAELMAAFADPETAAVWCARGGYGVVRILDRLDFGVIGRNPKCSLGSAISRCCTSRFSSGPDS